MTTAASLAVEMELDRLEAALLAGDATILTSHTCDQLAARALATDDAALHVRARVLVRWSLYARLASHPAIRAASAMPRDLAGLAARHVALHQAISGLGFASPTAFFDAIHGPCDVIAASDDDASPVDDGRSDDASHGGDGSDRQPISFAAPDATAIAAALATRHGLDTGGVDLRTGDVPGGDVRGRDVRGRDVRGRDVRGDDVLDGDVRSGYLISGTVTVTPGPARAVVGVGADGLATAALTLHEAGHALYRAQQRGMSLLAAAPPTRWFDEAIAAWAVRALEDEAFVRDEEVRAEASRRRLRREDVTRRLAAFEAAVFAAQGATRSGLAEAEATVRAAWTQTGLREPAAYPALFDEPGAMASYVAADRARLEPAPGDLRAWATLGAALDLTPWLEARQR